ncbi:MAG: aspartyl protease family protein [Bacteroidota bacterium]|nr:aspartyl protease family protein [Bacteroidota bacterium]
MEIIPIDEDGFHCFVDIQIENGVKARMLLDTGAAKTVFDINFLKQNKIESKFTKQKQDNFDLEDKKKNEIFFTELDIKIGENEYPEFYTELIDLSPINLFYKAIEIPEIQGTIGNDLLYYFDAVIDFENEKLTVKGY